MALVGQFGSQICQETPGNAGQANFVRFSDRWSEAQEESKEAQRWEVMHSTNRWHIQYGPWDIRIHCPVCPQWETFFCSVLDVNNELVVKDFPQTKVAANWVSG